MLRTANVMDVAGYAGVVIGALSNSPLWWAVGLLGIGLLLLSGHLSPEPDEAPNAGGTRG